MHTERAAKEFMGLSLMTVNVIQESAGPKRVDILYLADSVLQNCRNPKCAGCGPDSAPAQAYPRVIAAALPALIKAVSEDSEGARKADKVRHTLWTSGLLALLMHVLQVCE